MQFKAIKVRSSLMQRLVLAFFLVAIVSSLLVAVTVRMNNPEALGRLMREQIKTRVKAQLLEYYRQEKTFERLQADLDAGYRIEGLALAPVPAPAMAPQQVPPDGPYPVFPNNQPLRYFIGLADAAGTVILSPEGRYPSGQKLALDELEGEEPVLDEGVVVGYLLEREGPPEFTNAEITFLRRTDQALLWAALGAVLSALLIGSLLARTLTSPLFRLTQAANRISSGDLEQEVPVGSNDEMGELATAFNHMSKQVANANRLRRQMTSDIAHDLRTPLTVIGGYVESMRDGVLEPTPERLAVIYAEIEQLQRLVTDLRTLAQTDAGELTLTRQLMEPVDLLEHTAAAYQVAAGQKNIRLRVDVDGDLPWVDVDGARMMQILGNLVDNSLRFTPPGGEICLGAQQADGKVVLFVRDTGQGIVPEDLPYVFSRLYRGDKARSGENGESGLGLAIARALVDAHGGAIRAISEPGKGTEMLIELPAA